eukprot:scaffold21007_cov73-Phaeocystis_antarctica.AAC.2
MSTGSAARSTVVTGARTRRCGHLARQGVTTPTSEETSPSAREGKQAALCCVKARHPKTTLPHRPPGRPAADRIVGGRPRAPALCQASALRLAPRSKVQPDETQQDLMHRRRRVGLSNLSALLGACGVQAQSPRAN